MKDHYFKVVSEIWRVPGVLYCPALVDAIGTLNRIDITGGKPEGEILSDDEAAALLALLNHDTFLRIK